ncbi:hypothetical protein [Nesterenkonia flava]|uniref:Uncharacterized protein n=1 Tax=Nesterenkonia flava TaxID=469799 RepID=A0ABU1FTS8_9MICC|nr:hypothetical protein [Nesterenkonia flava]MDR5712055.1 hypothetical protein [Nesterenkonia flava]
MSNIPYPDVSKSEQRASLGLYHYLKQAASYDDELKPSEALPGSPFAEDEAAVPKLPTKQKAHYLLSAGYGCLLSLRRWLGLKREGQELHVTVYTHGGYALLRNALECGATSLWLLEPDNSKDRIRRMLLLHLDEIRNYESFALSMGDSVAHLNAKRTNIDKYAAQAGLKKWNPSGPNGPKIKGQKADKLPSMTATLNYLEQYRVPETEHDMPWLSAWQLSSGFAHGKLWAASTAQELIPQVGSEHEHGATFHVRTKLESVLAVTVAAYTLLEAGMRRYRHLSNKNDA